MSVTGGNPQGKLPEGWNEEQAAEVVQNGMSGATAGLGKPV